MACCGLLCATHQAWQEAEPHLRERHGCIVVAVDCNAHRQAGVILEAGCAHIRHLKGNNIMAVAAVFSEVGPLGRCTPVRTTQQAVLGATLRCQPVA